MTFERMEFLSATSVPDYCDLILGSRCEFISRTRPGNLTDPAVMIREVPEALPIAYIPDSDAIVAAGGGQQRSIG
jgi:hypothetical protein